MTICGLELLKVVANERNLVHVVYGSVGLCLKAVRKIFSRMLEVVTEIFSSPTAFPQHESTANSWTLANPFGAILTLLKLLVFVPYYVFWIIFRLDAVMEISSSFIGFPPHDSTPDSQTLANPFGTLC